MKETIFDLCSLVQQAMFLGQPLTRFPEPAALPGSLKNLSGDDLAAVVNEAVAENILAPFWVRKGNETALSQEEWDAFSQEQMAAYILSRQPATNLMGLGFTTGGHYLYCEECSERNGGEAGMEF